jgi:hypothetical protein
MGNVECGSINGLDEDSFILECLKLLANPYDIRVFDHDWCQRPNIGDHVVITNCSMLDDVNECIRVSQLAYHVVKEVIPNMILINQRYYWEYSISIEGSNLKLLQWHYEIIS